MRLNELAETEGKRELASRGYKDTFVITSRNILFEKQ